MAIADYDLSCIDPLHDFARWARHSRLLAEKTVQDRLVILRCALREEGRWFPAGLPQATNKQIKRYVESLIPTAATRNAARLAFLAYFECQIDLERRLDNPADILPSWKPNEPVHKPLLPDEAQRLLGAAFTHSAKVDCLVSGYLHSGVRLSELSTRHWKDVNGTWLYFPAKGGRRQARYLPPPAMNSLERYKGERPSKVLMFPAPDSREPVTRRWVYNTIVTLGDSVGIDNCHPHRLRHTFAQKLYDETGDIHLVQVCLVQVCLGHTNIQNTLRYARQSRRGVEEVLGSLRY